MKRCLSCSAQFPVSDTTCPACGWQPETRNGFPAYAPAFAHEGGGFKASYFSELARLEANNFWFRGRNRLLLWALEKYCPGFQSMLEIGCGTGYVMSGVAEKYPQARLSGSEIFVAGLTFAASRQPRAQFMQMDARQIPFVDEFDVVGAFDVIEHIEEDEAVLQQMRNALRPRGMILLTVPQHMWLWSPVDEYACHVRRYTAAELLGKLEHAGFAVVRSTSFVSSLLPAMLASRVVQKLWMDKEGKKIDATSELRLSPWLNRALEMFLNAEAFLIRAGISLPVGGSRLVIARRVD